MVSPRIISLAAGVVAVAVPVVVMSVGPADWNGSSMSEQGSVSQKSHTGSSDTSVTGAQGDTAEHQSGDCWSKSVQQVYRGGLTHRKMFGLWQRLEVCADSGRITSVRVVAAGAETFGYAATETKDLKTYTYNAGTDGEGLVTVRAVYGASLGGHVLGFSKTLGLKIYLDADGKSFRYTGETTL